MGGKNNFILSTYLLTFSDYNLFGENNLEKILQAISNNRLSIRFNTIIENKEIKIYITIPEKDFNKIKNIFKTFMTDVFFEKTILDLKDRDYRSFGLKKHYSIPLSVNTESQNILYKQLMTLSNNEYFDISLNTSPYRSIRPYINRKEVIAGKRIHTRIYNPIALFINIFFYTSEIFNKLFELFLINKKYIKNRKYIDQYMYVSKLDKLYSSLFKVDIMIATNFNLDIISDLINSINQTSLQKLSENILDRKNNVFSISEISSILSIPDLDEIKNLSNVTKIKHFEPSKDNLGKNILVLATNKKNSLQDIGLKSEDRKKHLLVLGSTGSGKSTLFKNIINQDIESGKGLTLIDPHGDLARMIHADNNKVLYFDPIKSNIKLNLLERKFPRSDYRYKLETEIITENVVSILSKLFSNDDEMGHRIEFVLRNACYLALEEESANLYTIQKIFNDKNYRDELLNKTSNLTLKNYWTHEFNKAGDYQRVKLISGITSKIGRLINSPILGSIFNCYKSNLNFEDIILNKKVLVCNLSKGAIGEHTSSLLGSMVIAKLQLAAYSMNSINESERVDHYLYIDESQNFIGSTLIQLISESRKYHIYLNMAQQSLSQNEDKFNKIILANVGNIITFRSPSPADSSILTKVYGDISERNLMDLPNYNFYMRSLTKNGNILVNGEVIN